MRRALPWVLSAILLVAFVASFSELQRMRTRFGQVTRHAFHDHADVRLAVIRSAMTQETHPIVILGDSVAELARFPSSLCGKPVVNAGIGGATLEELTRIANEFDTATLVIIVAGTNNAAATVEAAFSKLLEAIKPPKMAVAATVHPANNKAIIDAAKRAGVTIVDVAFSQFIDVHPTPKAYQLWMPKVIEAISGECARLRR